MQAAELGAGDYLMLGAGTAGCVLANRLSKDPRGSAYLVEAGPPDRRGMGARCLLTCRLLATRGPNT